MDFLVENEIFDYTKKEICEHANVSWNTLESFWDRMVKKGIVIPTRKIGKSQMFKLNLENPVVQKLMEIDEKLVIDSITSMKAEEMIPIRA